MALTKITKTGITADAIDATKIADNAVESAQIKADAVNATKIADDSISEEHLDKTAITGHTELSASADPSDVLLIYDADADTLKKITAGNVGLQAPTISSVSPTSVAQGDGTGNFTFTITGTNFVTGSTATLINTSGTTVNFDTVTRNSVTQITGVIAKTSINDAGEPYDVKVTTPQNLTATLEDQINVDQSPVFVTASGSLGSIGDANRSGVSKSVNATDPDSAGNVTFEIQSGSLPAGLTLTNTAAEGGTAIIAGNASAVGSDTTSNFVLRAVDAASNTSSRAFSITILAPTVAVFTASGTFSVPAGVSVADVLVVAGGGGASEDDYAGGGYYGGGAGAGGLIYRPSMPVTPGGTVTVTVGNGGVASNAGQDSVFGTLTAKGGGYGRGECQGGQPGGSGAGGGKGGQGGGSGIQPTQAGDSGTYGFGTPGGTAGPYSGGGGGGAGATGANGGGAPTQPTMGLGGVGKAYSIADGTTPVFYAGGGGGGGHGAGQGGQGGGAPRNGDGEANKGGGAGAGNNKTGGKGIVIVRWTV